MFPAYRKDPPYQIKMLKREDNSERNAQLIHFILQNVDQKVKLKKEMIQLSREDTERYGITARNLFDGPSGGTQKKESQTKSDL